MFESNRYSDYLSISQRHLRLIQSEDRIPADDPNCFELLSVTVTTNLAARWDLDYIDTCKGIIRRCQETLHRNARKTGMLLPFSNHKVSNTRQSYQSISIPPHTLSDWPVM